MIMDHRLTSWNLGFLVVSGGLDEVSQSSGKPSSTNSGHGKGTKDLPKLPLGGRVVVGMLSGQIGPQSRKS